MYVRTSASWNGPARNGSERNEISHHTAACKSESGILRVASASCRARTGGDLECALGKGGGLGRAQLVVTSLNPDPASLARGTQVLHLVCFRLIYNWSMDIFQGLPAVRGYDLWRCSRRSTTVVRGKELLTSERCSVNRSDCRVRLGVARGRNPGAQLGRMVHDRIEKA
jgi:hypothetical protein